MKMEDSPISRLSEDTLNQIFSYLSLREIVICRSVCKLFNQTLTSPSFMHLISTRSHLNLLAVRPPHHHHNHHNRHVSLYSFIHVYDPDQNQWLRFSLDFLPFRSPHPVASSLGLLYLWADTPDSNKSLIVCNPLTRQYKVLPQLGSAWSRHGSVLVDSWNRVMVLTELAALYFSFSQETQQWLKFSSNLPSKPRSPIVISNSVFALCDVGSPWRSKWKLFSCAVKNLLNLNLNVMNNNWECLERHEWGDIFDVMKRPRLVPGNGNKILMIGGLKSSYSFNQSGLTILILRLDLETMEWEEATRMPEAMLRWFQDSKFKVFGGGNRVCFSGKKIRRLALWDCCKWRWIDGVPGNGDELFRGFTYEARLTAVP
ncbi:SKP1-interacting partner 15-like [Hibiscus syriacus]|nr:SKP1-interacting partner 15-like [Hibiscus syriacus]